MKPIYNAIPFMTEDLAANSPNISKPKLEKKNMNSTLSPTISHDIPDKKIPNSKQDNFAIYDPKKKPQQSEKKIGFSLDEIPLNKRDL